MWNYPVWLIHLLEVSDLVLNFGCMWPLTSCVRATNVFQLACKQAFKWSRAKKKTSERSEPSVAWGRKKGRGAWSLKTLLWWERESKAKHFQSGQLTNEGLSTCLLLKWCPLNNDVHLAHIAGGIVVPVVLSQSSCSSAAKKIQHSPTNPPAMEAHQGCQWVSKQPFH